MNGLDHVAILVSDLDAAVKLYRDVYGLELAEIVDEKPRPGAGGSKVAFVHPKGSRGVLVELKQAK
jgi:methylmalonyl-CoA/ethylmalonyl-CoA epimerase